MDSPVPATDTPSYPPTPSSPDLATEIDQLSINPSPSPAPPSQVKVDVEDAELERFRNQWREEVKAKKGEPVHVGARRTGIGKGKEKEVEVGPVRWKSKQNDQPPAAEPDLPSERSGGSEKSLSPVKDKNKLSSPVSPKKPLRFVPGEAVDLDKLDSYLTTTTFTSFKPTSVNRPTRFTGSIAPAGQERESAIQIYQRAIESEQSGKLNEALMLYRKAFKLDDDIDRTYAISLKNKSTAIAQDSKFQETELPPTPSSSDIISSKPPSIEPYSFARHIQTAPDYEKTHLPAPASTTTSLPALSRPAESVYPISPLTRMFNNLSIPSNELTFHPDEEELPCPITKLPNELFEPILMNLDVTSIERFGSACWKSRWLTHVSLAWRDIAERIYKPPAMLPPAPQIAGDMQERLNLVKRHRNEWRTTVVEEERIRMDGCYIAVCHYIRPGAGEEWVTVITYHRFLRFYPDGNVISFLTTDHPSEIVPSLRPSIRGKGLHFGRWRLNRSDSDNNSITNVNSQTTKDSKRFARVIITDLLEPGNESPKYEFEMELILKSTGRGRWNKLEILEYRSINLMTGEVLALALKHQKPFYFSKVRSYNPPF
ncbi:hypothetical protein L486_00577 [Kwoniella mangroviensis CBS 10435]|uniref:F-box domain-containing protein n=1 Tax=Kwoniella mangroviensis CBS 10435 TaxID=1331196 RepID=A0A1B9IZJ3_9TREE|nr:hypothetical protein L486_00577 [Kwoniella mangroviensis CBS 10435]